MSDTTVDTKEKTFDKFAKNFEITFYPFDIKATACSNLTNLIQKSFQEEDGTFNNGFQKFITNFQNLATKAGMSDETTLIDHFSLRIDQQIATIILSMLTIPITLKEWIEKKKPKPSMCKRCTLPPSEEEGETHPSSCSETLLLVTLTLCMLTLSL